MEKISRRSIGAVLILGITLSAGGLLYGGVDRGWQILLVLGLFAGMCVHGVSWNGKISKAGWIFLAAIVVWLAGELRPVNLADAAFWRRSMAEDYGVATGNLRNPAPANVLDALLMLLVAVLWYVWVRKLMQVRNGVEAGAWVMVVSAAVFAGVCLWMRTVDTELMYGTREVAGWQGFGPFPNRNHSASLIAMGLMMGLAMFARCVVRRAYAQAGGAAICCVVLVTALVMSGSRGGVVAAAAGVVVLALILGLRMRRRVIVSIAAGVLLVGISALMLFGGAVIERFSGDGAGGVSGLDGRADIWRSTLEMVQEAPLFGHGAATFPIAYPFHQRMLFENRITLHPESSILLWLAEYGLLAGGLAFVGLAVLITPAWRLLRNLHAPYSFYRAGAFAALGVALTHAFFDVAMHRWGTFFYALTALGVLMGTVRLPQSGEQTRVKVPLMWVPLVIAVFWAMPLFTRYPVPTQLTAEMLLAENADGTGAPIADVEKALAIFPLHIGLNELAGHLKLQNPATRSDAWKHFQVVNRLHPDSWSIPAQQAISTAMLEPGMALNYWTEAISRSGTKADETLNMAIRFTANFPNALDFWTGFAIRNPHLLLSVARLVEDEYAQPLYSQWINSRLTRPQLEPYEIRAFYQVIGQYGTVDHFLDFIDAHLDRSETDLREWLRVLAGFKDYRTAWAIAEPHLPPDHSPDHAGNHNGALQRWLTHPHDLLNARTLVESLNEPDELTQKRRILTSITARKDIPHWFRVEAARAAAVDGDYETAVTQFQQTL